jgi:hypothetical protein
MLHVKGSDVRSCGVLNSGEVDLLYDYFKELPPDK